MTTTPAKSRREGGEEKKHIAKDPEASQERERERDSANRK